MVFCTLFDSNYMDKGLVMYRSLRKHTDDLQMYILAMDEQCGTILNSYGYDHLTVIPVDEFSVKMGLEEIRKTRKRGEFCWTCTSHLIDYILTEYHEEQCTYVDSDLRFYADPQCLLDEMKDQSIQIVEHRFENSALGRMNQSISGTYCVQFNTFRNEEEALDLLHWWEEKCRESCSNDSDREAGVYGDQGYLELWGQKETVNVLSNPGGGVAPWNVSQYRFLSMNPEKEEIMLQDKRSKKSFQLVFYHFHNISYITPRKVNINVFNWGDIDPQITGAVYIPYLREIDAVKTELQERFGFYPYIQHHPGLEEKKPAPGKSIAERIKAIDSQVFSKIYLRTVIKKKKEKWEKNSIISF